MAFERKQGGNSQVNRKSYDKNIEIEELMVMLGLKETIDKLARANSVHWFGHVLRRDKDVLRKAL